MQRKSGDDTNRLRAARRTARASILSVPAAMLLLLTATSAQAQETVWLVAPYGWLPDISLAQSGGGDSPSGGISGEDLLSKTDTTGMIRVEAARGRFGVTVDYLFISLSDQGVFETPGPLLPSINIRAELDVQVLEVGGFYRPSGDDRGFDYLVGVRSIDSDETLLATPEDGPTQRFDTGSRLTDLFVGARYLYRFNDRWDLGVRGDIGFGESDGTVNVIVSGGYRFPGPFALQLGYRYVNLEYTETVNGDDETTEIEFNGPFVGALFRF